VDLGAFDKTLPELRNWDPYYQWTFHLCSKALSDARCDRQDHSRSGLILGNLAFATESSEGLLEEALIHILESEVNFLEGRELPTRNYPYADVDLHHSARPAQLCGKYFGFGLDPFAIDAACASSLYVVDLACRKLWSGEADLMVAMGVNRAEMIAMQVGFSQLGAYSPTHRCKPFDKNADGLVVGEGGGALVLKKLSDALAAGDEIHCLIMGTGLSGDGQEGGLLTPSSKGQIQAMHSAYSLTGIDPASIDLLECHGTGTPVGDSVELQSIRSIFQSSRTRALAVGSVKSMVGHCLSSAGMASLIKVILAMKKQCLPPTLMESPCAFLEENKDWIEPVRLPLPWNRHNGPRRAGVSGFGFGGTNAHTILQEWDSELEEPGIFPGFAPPEKVAIVAMDCEVGTISGLSELRSALSSQVSMEDQDLSSHWPSCTSTRQLEGSRHAHFLKDRKIPIGRFRMTPREMEHLLPQQLLMLELADRCMRENPRIQKTLDPDKTGVVIGLNWHPHLANHTIRLKAARSLSLLLDRLNRKCSQAQWEELLEEYKNLVSSPVIAEDVIGDIPNFPANRISTEFDLKGPSFVVFQEENSGLKALEIARAYLQTSTVDTMIVGAVDLPLEMKYVLANQRELLQTIPYSEGGAILILKRLEDSQKLDLSAYAQVESLSSCTGSGLSAEIETLVGQFQPSLTSSLNPALDTPLSLEERNSFSLDDRLGYARAAQGLLGIISASLMIAQRWIPLPGSSSSETDSKILPWLRDSEDSVRRILLHGSTREDYHQVLILGDTGQFAKVEAVSGEPVLSLYAGKTHRDLSEALLSGNRIYDTRNLDPGLKILSVVSKSHAELESRTREAIGYLREDPDQILDPNGTYYLKSPLYKPGSLAVVYPGFGNIYPGMGRSLLSRFPHLIHSLERRTDHARTLSASDVLWQADNPDLYSMSVMEISTATTFLSCVLTRLFLDTYQLKPDHVIGFSGGEINSLCALDLWDMNHYFEDAKRSPLFSNIACGEFQALPDHLRGQSPVDWRTFLIQAEETEIQNALQGKEGVYLLMVNAPGECMIGGLNAACEEFLARSGLENRRIPMPQIYHSELLAPFKDELFELWDREFKDPGDLVFHSHARAKSYRADRSEIARSLVETCTSCVRFEPVVEKAYEDGVRVFLELGPNSSVSRYIQKILKDRPHLTVAVNLKERSELLQLAHGLGILASQGVGLDLCEFQNSLMEVSSKEETGSFLTLPISSKQEGRDILEFSKHIAALPSMDLPQVAAEVGQAPEDDQPSPRPQPDSQRENMRRDFFEAQTKLTELHQNFLKEQEFLLQLESGAVPARDTSIEREPLPSYSLEAPAFDQQDILNFAHGKIADVFGPEFEIIDSYPFRTRFPSPPYLLVSRVTEIEGKLHEFKPSRVVTEFDVSGDEWFLVDGRVPISVCIESGQADLFLISYLGIDHKVKGERVYRLLGADFTFFDTPPKAPCTLRYEIHITSFVEHEGTWLFFFEGVGTCSGKPFIRWVNGCAGYFTPEELLAKSATSQPEIPQAQQLSGFSPVRTCLKTSFGQEELNKLVAGDIYGCFGEGFEVPFPGGSSLSRTIPQWANHDLRMVDEIEVFPSGGTHGCGYLKAKLNLRDDHWYFTSHFVTDNVMPGTLMLDGCTQVLDFYLLYCGQGFQARGGRFQPVQNQEIKVKCRGQVIPGMRDLSYFINIRSVENGYRPTVIADALLTSEGKEIVHIENLAMEVFYESVPELPPATTRGHDIFGREVRANEAQMLQLTMGAPSTVFGESYKEFDTSRKLSRMPNPPFSCITRVIDQQGTPGDFSPGATLLTEMDLYHDDWFFQSSFGILPFCILSEALLQPCGLLAQFLEHDLCSDHDRFIRNLSGKMKVHRAVPNTTRRLICQVQLESATHLPEIFLVQYSGTIRDEEGNLIAEGEDLSFGFFTREALENSPGFALQEDEIPPNPGSTVLSPVPSPKDVGTILKMPLEPCLFFDQIIAYDPNGSSAGLSKIAALKKVRPTEWIFFSHFYEDPVMPGSYSLDAISQVLRYLMALEGMEMDGACFVTSPFEWMEWEYKGQINLDNEDVVYEVEVLEKSLEPTPYLKAKATVYCDGRPIYRIKTISASLV
jgi:PfaB family protein